MLSLGVIPANIAINDISLKLDSLGYISSAESIGVSQYRILSDSNKLETRIVMTCKTKLSKTVLCCN